MDQKDLFTPIVPQSKFSSFFQQMLSPAAEPARIMMNRVFQNFPDVDGNFMEQFQSSGFDPRIFELYLFAYLSHARFAIDRDYKRPDFIVYRDEIGVAIEATTSNPKPGYKKDSATIEKLLELTKEEIIFRGNEEIPIRLGSPLYSKLQRKYWELEQCKGLPFVIAIEAFHDETSYLFDDISLGQYLYGLRQYPYETEEGEIGYIQQDVLDHKMGDKKIPSNFFKQENSEHISAIMFSNSGTYSKFKRLGYQKGFHRGNLSIFRLGTNYISYKDTITIESFFYDLENPLIYETWGQGLVIFHNPQAIIPLPKEYFPDAAETYLDEGKFYTDLPGFQPQGSMTYNIIMADIPEIYPDTHIRSILKCAFDDLHIVKKPDAEFFFQEKQWFLDIYGRIAGVIIEDKFDKDWNWVIFGRDHNGRYNNLDMGSIFLDSRKEATEIIVRKMEDLYLTGQEFFD